MALTLKVDNGEFIFSGRSIQITKDKNNLLKDYNKQIYNYTNISPGTDFFKLFSGRRR